MKALRWLFNIGTFILISVMPLVAWTGFYDSVEEPKMAVALWSSVLIICTWLVGCLAGKLRFWPQSSLTKAGTLFYVLMAASGIWAGLGLHLLEYTIFYATNALLLMAWDSAFHSPLMDSLFIKEADKTNQATEASANSTAEEKAIPKENASENYIWYLLGCLSATCLLACAYAYLQKITPLGITIFGLPIADPMNWDNPHLSQERTISTFSNPNYSGVWIASVLPLALSWIYTCIRHKWSRYLAFASWLFCALAMIFTQTRAAWLGLACGLVVWFATMLICSAERRSVIRTGITLLLGLALLTSAYMFCGERNLQQVNHKQLTISERLKSFKNLSDPSLQARLWFWKSALKTSLAFPWTGVGPYGQVQANLLERDSEPMYTRPNGSLPTSTHSQFFHTLATAGWPALILCLISIGFAINSALRIKSAPLKAAFLSAIVTLWTAHIFTSFIVSAAILWIFIMATISTLSEQTQQSVQDSDINIDLWQLSSKVRMAIFIASTIILVASIATLMDLASLRFGALGNKYFGQAQALSQQPNKPISKILLTYDQANAYYELASALSPAWMTWNYNLEISRVFRQVYVEVLPEPDEKILFKAVEYASIAAAFAPEKTTPLLNWASILAKTPQGLEEALRLTNRALGIDPRNPRILIAKAQFLIELQRFSEALEVLDKIESITPDLPTALYSRFVILLLTNKEKEAEQIMNKLEHLDPLAKHAAEEFRQHRNREIQRQEETKPQQR